jgi:dTDP-4-amino-4,6-dideoxygalactose transaminase
MAVPRHNINLSSAELRLIGRVISGNSSPSGSRQIFERQLASFLGVAHVRAVQSGRVALHLALVGLNLQPGDVVVLPRYCFYSLPHVVQGMGLIPRWAPVDPATMALDPEQLDLEGAAAVVLIHPFGQVGPVAKLRARCDAASIPLIEDGSQATGGALNAQRVGSLGKAGVFSMVSGKNLQTFGGGFVSTDDPTLIARIDQRLGSQPQARPQSSVQHAMRSGLAQWALTSPVGFSGLMHPMTLAIQTLSPGRLEAMFHEERLPYDPDTHLHCLSDSQAELGSLQLQQLDLRNAVRREHAHRLMDGLRGIHGLQLPAYNPAADNTWNALAVRVKDGPALQHSLRKRGVDTRSDYMTWYGPAQDFAEDVIYLPNHPGMSGRDVERVVRAVRGLV